MRRIIAVLASVVLVAVATAAGAPRTAPGHFSVVLSYTPTGWSAQCEVGCSSAWKAGFSCDTACDAQVDARGVVTLAEERTADPRFAFNVQHTPDGVMATSGAGTAWTTLAWSCATQPCRARITDLGVSLLGN